MTDLAIVYRDPATLRGYDANARVHGPDQLRLIRRSIEEYGFTNPVLLREDGVSIGAGHGRVAASLLAPALDSIPTIIIPGLTEEQWRAYILMDNQSALTSSWDETLLRQELGDLKSLGFDMSLTGFGEVEVELGALFGDAADGRDPEEAPPAPETPVSRLGDIWRCGPHRVGCLDSLDIEQVKRLLGGVVPAFANCDAPYGISVVKAKVGARAADGGAKAFGKVGGGKPHPFAGKGSIGGHQNTPKNELGARGSVHSPGPDGVKRGRGHGPAKRAIVMPGLYAPIIGDDTTETAVASHRLFEALGVPIIVMWGGNYFADQLPPSRCWLVWDKENTESFADVELAWTNRDAVARIFKHQWSGLIKASERGEKRVHPTQKPVALAEWVHQTCAPDAKTVLDLFLGGGAVLIGAERAGITCYGSELSPNYVDVCVQRWQAFTGQEATLEDGTPWSVVAQDRIADEEAV